MYKEKTMADKKIVLRILAVALVFGLFVSCSDGGTWKQVASLSDVVGTWKATVTAEDDYAGVPLNGVYDKTTHTVTGSFLDPAKYAKVTNTPVWVVDPTDVEPGIWKDVWTGPKAIVVLDDVTEKVESVLTFTVNADGSGSSVTEITFTYSGDSLETNYGFAYGDPDKVVYNGWKFIKEAEGYETASTTDADGSYEKMTVSDANYTVTYEEKVVYPASYFALTDFANDLINADKNLLLSNGQLYVKQ